MMTRLRSWLWLFLAFLPANAMLLGPAPWGDIAALVWVWSIAKWSGDGERDQRIARLRRTLDETCSSLTEIINSNGEKVKGQTVYSALHAETNALSVLRETE